MADSRSLAMAARQVAARRRLCCRREEAAGAARRRPIAASPPPSHRHHAARRRAHPPRIATHRRRRAFAVRSSATRADRSSSYGTTRGLKLRLSRARAAACRRCLSPPACVRRHLLLLLVAALREALQAALAGGPASESGGGACGEDAFLLHSVVAPGAAVKEPVTALDSVNLEWFSARKKQVFMDSGIRASFVGASVAARLVTVGAVELLREVLDRSEPEWRAADAAAESGRRLLDLAVGLGRADIVQVLLEYGADADTPSRGPDPPRDCHPAHPPHHRVPQRLTDGPTEK